MRASEISRSGLDVEWRRLQVIAENLANANTSRSASGGPYRPMRLLSGPASATYKSLAGGEQPQGVQVRAVQPIAGGVRRVHEPGHPDADAQGFVTYPDIDQAGEMALMIKTERAYEANLTAMNMAQQMYSKALELGNKS